MMKYQDDTQENAFWRQLLEIKDEWENCEMVGTLSAIAHTKINIDVVNRIIQNREYETKNYVHFADTGKPIAFKHHPYMKQICTDVARSLSLTLPTENLFNYWMCKPPLMTEFIHWFEKRLKPAVVGHPLSRENAHYKGPLDASACQLKFGVPYYPHTPFVLERFNKCFFDKHRSTILIISHENSLTGAPIALTNLSTFLMRNGYNTVFISIDKFLPVHLTGNNLCAIMVNTTVLYKWVLANHHVPAPIYWWVHEWIDENNKRHFETTYNNGKTFNLVNKLFFPCISAKDNYLSYLPYINKSICDILPYGFPIQTPMPDYIPKKDNSILLTIVGSIAPRKNQQAFIDSVFVPLLGEYPTLRLRIIGKEHRRLVLSNEVRNSIELTGEVKDVGPHIADTDIHISYSLNEVLPLNILEVMRLGRAIIATDVGGCKELISHGESGYLVSVNDHEKCKAYIKDLIAHPEKRCAFGAASKVKYVQYIDEVSFGPFLKYLSTN